MSPAPASCLFASVVSSLRLCLIFFFFNDTATTEIYTLSLHDALPICRSHWMRWRSRWRIFWAVPTLCHRTELRGWRRGDPDRKSTRLNSSHSQISYAVFCLKKKKNDTNFSD